MTYQISLDVFEGPFDLLLHLIKKNEIDIYDIPIAEITRQYLDYLHEMETLDMEIASSFVLMAANLLIIKAKMLLPATPSDDEEELEVEDAREELVRDLLEYMRYKEVAADLNDRAQKEMAYFTRPNEEELYLQLFAGDDFLSGKTVDDITTAFNNLLAKAQKRGLVMNIKREQITIASKIEDIYRAVKEAPQAQGLPFSQLFAACVDRMEMVVMFLALLELMRQSVIRALQAQSFGEIYLIIGDKENYQNCRGEVI